MIKVQRLIAKLSLSKNGIPKKKQNQKLIALFIHTQQMWNSRKNLMPSIIIMDTKCYKELEQKKSTREYLFFLLTKETACLSVLSVFQFLFCLFIHKSN